MALKSPILRYFGGKWLLARWIISQFPEEFTCYVEPYGGAGSVLSRKQPSEFEVYNDLSSDMVTFFRVLRSRVPELVDSLALTPFSREEFERAYEPVEGGDDLEVARRCFVRHWQGFGCPSREHRTGWKCQSKPYDNSRADYVSDWVRAQAALELAAARWRRVQIEHMDALKVIKRYDATGTLFYCDPTYPADTRKDRWARCAYQHEMSFVDHDLLASLLHGIKGKAIVSSYPNEQYEALYKGWRRVEKGGYTQAHTECTEVLWMNW